MFQGACWPGNRQKWKVDWISIQIEPWKQKCREGGAKKLKFWVLMGWTTPHVYVFVDILFLFIILIPWSIFTFAHLRYFDVNIYDLCILLDVMMISVVCDSWRGMCWALIFTSVNMPRSVRNWDKRYNTWLYLCKSLHCYTWIWDIIYLIYIITYWTFMGFFL